ncbi:MAG: exosortase/archaeosortase family protein, partial [Planctomycetota bacterium]
DPDFSHGFLVPPIALWLLFREGRWLEAEGRGSALGLAFLSASLVLFALGDLSLVNFFQRAGSWGMLVGAFWFLFGWEPLRRHPFPWFFLLFAIPPPFEILSPIRLGLKRLATQLAADITSLAGVPAIPDGNVLVAAGTRLEVADACSGVRSLFAMLATAVLFAHLFRTGLPLGTLLAASAVPVVVLWNSLRVVSIALALAWFEVDLAHGAAHEAIGFAVFGLGVASLYLLWTFYAWLVRRRPRPEAP